MGAVFAAASLAIISAREREARGVQSRMVAVVVISIGTVLSMLDQSIANTALPSIARDVHASAAASIWVVNAYQLALTIAVIPLSAVGDATGYARLYRAGLLAFILASLACMFAHDLGQLVAARFVQGLSGAAMTVTTGPILRQIYPPERLGRATGYSAMAVALGAAAGPVVSGLVLSVATWPWLFALNIPIGLVALGLGLRVIPSYPGHGRPFDVTSATLSAATFGCGLFGLDGIAHHAPRVLVASELAVALVVGTIFIRRQLAQAEPMFAVDLFARTPFTLAVVACYASFVGQTIAYIALPFAFQTVLNRTPLEVGLLLLPWLLAAAAMAPLAGQLADRFNSSRLAAIGLSIFALGLGATALLPPHASSFDIAWRMLVCGIGYGLFQSPNNRSIQNSAPRERSGAPQGIQAVARLTGQTTGAVTVAIVFGLASNASHAASGTNAAAIAIAMTLATGCAVVAAIASVWRGTITGAIRLRPSRV
jgi:DHA2 family multidrug resistance protein-like MFS transporter